jgi:hypothetical protein
MSHIILKVDKPKIIPNQGWKKKKSQYMYKIGWTTRCRTASFELIFTYNKEVIINYILVTAAILIGGQCCRTQYWKRRTQGISHPNLVKFDSVGSED